MIGELKNDQIKEYEIHPSDFGLNTAKTDSFKVADAEESKKIVLSVLDNQTGPALDIVCLNAGAALYAGNLAKDIGEGLQMAKAAIANGKAKQKLDEFIKTTQNLAK